jgi:putative peptidoglycan lipid II flippase
VGLSEGSAGGGSHGRRIGAAAALLAGSVLLSQLIGYVREMVLAHQVGVTPAMDAYRAAFQIPDILFHLLAGGALSIAFIPVYTRAREQRGAEAAERLFATVLGTLGAAALVFTAVLWVYAGPLVAFLFGGFDDATQALCVRLTRIVLPAQVFFVTGGILRAVLMADGRFGAQAAAPLVYNIAIIAGGVGLGRGPEGFAWGVLVGAALGPFGIALWDAARSGRIRIRIAPLDGEFLRYLLVALPLMIGASLLTVDEWYEKAFGDEAGEGVIASLGYARQLMLAPVRVVGQAIGAAALPTLAILWNAGRREELDRVVEKTLQASTALAVLGGVAVFAVARPLVAALFERGAFGADDTVVVAGLLQILSFAVPGWVVQQIAVRAFYARSDTWRPMLLGSAVALLALPLYWALGRESAAQGLALAGVIAVNTNALATLLLARRLHGAPPLTSVFSALGASLLAALPAAFLAGLAQRGAPGLPGALTDLVLGGGIFAAVALPIAWFVGGEPVRGGLRRLLRRRS